MLSRKDEAFLTHGVLVRFFVDVSLIATSMPTIVVAYTFAYLSANAFSFHGSVKSSVRARVANWCRRAFTARTRRWKSYSNVPVARSQLG